MSDRGGEVVEIRPEDVVYTAPGEEHWHGATPDRFMAAHVATREEDDEGRVAMCLEYVTDEEYDGRRSDGFRAACIRLAQQARRRARAAELAC